VAFGIGSMNVKHWGFKKNDMQALNSDGVYGSI